jgi:saccharopine dehydrogenase-like NADP-dependent oxidoreductase
MRIAVLGAGAMGSAAAVLLARHDDIELLVLDVDLTRAEKIVGHIGRGEAREVDISGGSLADDLRDSGARTVAAASPTA